MIIKIIALVCIGFQPTYVVESANIKAMSQANQNLFKKNLPNAIKAEKLFISKGYSNEKCLLAIHANTWHESKWDPNCKSGNFVGMFQIGGSGTMGQGTTVAERKSIEFSVSLISSRQDFKSWYKKHKNSKSTVGAASKEFASKVLRCARQHVSSRGDTATRWKR